MTCAPSAAAVFVGVGMGVRGRKNGWGVGRRREAKEGNRRVGPGPRAHQA